MACNSESSVPELSELIVIVIVIPSSLPPGSTAPPHTPPPTFVMSSLLYPPLPYDGEGLRVRTRARSAGRCHRFQQASGRAYLRNIIQIHKDGGQALEFIPAGCDQRESILVPHEKLAWLVTGNLQRLKADRARRWKLTSRAVFCTREEGHGSLLQNARWFCDTGPQLQNILKQEQNGNANGGCKHELVR